MDLLDLLIVRHAIAVEHVDWKGGPDSERPLTDKGRALMKRNAAGLARAFPRLDLIATSPFVRAAQTAEIVKDAYGRVGIEEVSALASGGERSEVVAWLRNRRQQADLAEPAAHIALVGHEPDLGQLVSWLVSGQAHVPFEMRKGGACLLRFSEPPGAGRATLRWFASPSLLRKLAH